METGSLGDLKGIAVFFGVGGGAVALIAAVLWFGYGHIYDRGAAGTAGPAAGTAGPKHLSGDEISDDILNDKANFGGRSIRGVDIGAVECATTTGTTPAVSGTVELFTCYRVKWTGSVGGWQAEGYVDPTDGTVVLTATCSDPERVECSG
jgi:hypothetical protein